MANVHRLELNISLSGSEQRASDLSRDLVRDLTGAKTRARLNVSAPLVGERGAGGAIGTILIEVLNGTGLKAAGEIATGFLEVFKAYLNRERSLKFDIALPDGTKLALDSKNISAVSVEKLADSLIALSRTNGRP